MNDHDLSARRFLLFGFITLFVLVGGFGAWSTTTQIAGAVVAQGTIHADRHQHVLQHPDGGVIASILIREGDLVHAGDTLITLDGARHRSRQAIIKRQYREVLARIARLTAEQDDAKTVTYPATLRQDAQTSPQIADMLAGQTRLFMSRRNLARTQSAQLDKRASQIEQQKTGLDAQASTVKRQLALLRDDLHRQEGLLGEGLAPYPRVAALRREEAVLSGRLAEIAATQAEADLRLTETQLQKLTLQAEQRERAIAELRDHQATAAELSEKMRSIAAELDRLRIRAPVSGVVHGLQVHAPASVAQPGQAMLHIIPQDRPLQVTAQIQPSDIDQVFVGQPVTLTFPSFDNRGAPDLLASIDTISADAFADEKSGQSFYKIEIKVADNERAHLPPGVVLLPGMPATAFIKTGDRSPMSYLLQPLATFFGTALRES
ncbi:HlyD family type I secretion periplasmic adaptor subunit [Aliiroseovarius sp. S1339]|uniref:HlyD family type I secretion periplasmic adaptor subunit n=1 Tax=Aliiroseovarius sp. S1339 TaxID=2936990 RepID=UPI0020BFFBBB|nr:HlyD family type I secretion periplasmic adaptor subunit [Aliiroseovarius sp. S1339]MCK8464552.1 HlyD family type I secretion periplasmic adaptor subunit [Aliiroseovarius sp. S1339]